MKRIVLIALLSLVILAIATGAHRSVFPSSEEHEQTHPVEKPTHRNIFLKAITSGQIVPREEIALKSRVSGVLDEVHVFPGQSVEIGQLIARIRILPAVVQLHEAETELAEIHLQLEEKKRKLALQKRLLDQKLTTREQWQTQKHEVDLAKQQLQGAQQKLELLREGASSQASEESNLVYATARGTVLELPTAKGSFVIETNTFNEGTTIAVIADMKHMIFDGFADESDVGSLQLGMDMRVQVGALGEKTLAATLDSIGVKGIQKDGAVRFRIQATLHPAGDIVLRAGYSANGEIILDKREEVLSINERNLIYDGESTYVEILGPDSNFKRTSIQTGLSDGIHIEILAGLNANQAIRLL